MMADESIELNLLLLLKVTTSINIRIVHEIFP